MTWWHYLLLVNLYLVLFYGFYRLLLFSETFFQLNRIYLVVGAVLSFVIPAIQSAWVKDLFITKQIQQTMYYVSPELLYRVKPIENNPITIGEVVGLIYITGIIVLLARFVYQVLFLNKLIKKTGNTPAFSFFKKIKVDENLPLRNTIVAHELVHMRQWHSADVLFIEAVMIINWFNPIAYLYRKAIKQVHEFIADSEAIQTGVSKTAYAMLLLNQTFGTTSHQLTNNFFNNSLLKQRIIMLNKNKSKRKALLKYGLSAPLFALMLILSAATVNNSRAVKAFTLKTDQVLLMKASSLSESVKKVEKTFNQDTHTAKKEREVKAINIPTILKPDTFPKVTTSITATGTETTIEFKKDSSLKKTILAIKWDKEKSSTPVFIVDGKEISEAEYYKINPDDIKSIMVSKDQSNAKFVARGNGGSVLVTLKDTVKKDNQIFTAVETPPSFPGGIEKFYQFLANHIKYPVQAREKSIQGRVIAQFIVEKDGSLSEIKTLREPGYGLGDEAVRVLSISPKWNPGIQNGKPVRVQYTVPVNFSLGNDISSPIYILEGKEISSAEIKKIDPKTIESMDVLKGKSATKIYGEKGKNGVVLIKLKDTKQH